MARTFLLLSLLLGSAALCRAQVAATPSAAAAAKAAADEKWRSQFKATGLLGKATPAATPAAVSGQVSYTFHKPKEPSEEETKYFAQVQVGIDQALGFYNRNTKLKKHVDIFYDPGVPTANGNINGSIRLGKNARNARVLMHEICHTMGIGTHPKWRSLMVDHLWQGERANKLLQELTGNPKAQLHGDQMHFWPYGLNYDNEVKSDEDYIRHARLVEAMVKDLETAR